MIRTVQVILAIAIVCSAVEVGALIVDYNEPGPIYESQNSETLSAKAGLRWKVYWFGGLALAVIGYFLRRRFELPGLAWFIAGVYLMLLGNNAGFWGSGYVEYRLATSVLTFLGLTALILNERWERAT